MAFNGESGLLEQRFRACPHFSGIQSITTPGKALDMADTLALQIAQHLPQKMMG